MMKTLYMSLLGILLLLGNACGSKNGEGVSPRSYFRAELNGKKWGGNVQSGFISDDEWYLRSVVYADRQQLIHRGELGVNKIPLNKGKYKLNPMSNGSSGLPNTLGSSYGTLKDDGDVLDGNYKLYLPDSANNYIELTEVDIERKSFKGRFSGTYIRSNIDIGEIPDTMRFRNAEFFVVLK